jgi:hypothetical protein
MKATPPSRARRVRAAFSPFTLRDATAGTTRDATTGITRDAVDTAADATVKAVSAASRLETVH